MGTRSAVVGCAGWSVPRTHAALFGEGDSALMRYATRFPVVEINTSFYRPHRRETYARWAAAVPRTFRFSVKLPRTISHEARLRGVGPLLDRFLEETAGLGHRLGGYLLQLPPSLALDMRTVSTFLRMFRARTDARLACDPRHASWATPSLDALLARHDAARVIADPQAIHPPPVSPSPSWFYWRLHGSPRTYYSAYGRERLEEFARDIRALEPRARPWVIFDNTAHGHATADAALLQTLLGLASSAPARRSRPTD